MKRWNKTISFLFLTGSLIFVAGCTNQIPEMTEEENALVTEYAAGILLQYHADYDSRLVDTSIPPEEDPFASLMTETDAEVGEESEEDIEEAVSENNIAKEPVDKEPMYSIAQVVEAEGLDISCYKYKVCDSYPNAEGDMSIDNMLFAMNASAGNKLLVILLDISNPSGQEILINTVSQSELKCRITLNGSEKKNAYVSMLDNDFMLLNQTLAPGDNIQAAIVTEISIEEAGTISSVELSVKNGEKSANATVNN